MKFLVDENLPPALAAFIRQSGFTSRHINEFESKGPVSDDTLRRMSLYQDWIIVTKDDDFVRSYVNRRVPYPLIYVYQLYSRQEIIENFRKYWQDVVVAITQSELIEINPDGVKIHF